MKKLTYKKAYDKIIEAYFKDEIEPYDSNFCFCGSLAGGANNWTRVWNNGLYDGKDFAMMEKVLLVTIRKETIGIKYEDAQEHYFACEANTTTTRKRIQSHPNYEDALFNGMCAALEVLKQIHKERGEDVDGVQEFTKRKLKKNETTIIPN